ncbi:hypothetical protein PR048_026746 [Dryococelus australis]|uniref:Uncharacterized protein n=1 Tax=Dryococelus australis TaxID=614101 RepID=A0ABQ9GMA0_9NEOP|nr:hypothetical protein PR048_026746 [Dryococelus australis]
METKGEELSSRQKEQIHYLKRQFQDVLTTILRKCVLMPHKIEVSDDGSPFRKIIADLENQGIIRCSLSPYSSLAFLVKTKEQVKFRLILVYRLLNKKYAVDLFPMPNTFRFSICLRCTECERVQFEIKFVDHLNKRTFSLNLWSPS